MNIYYFGLLFIGFLLGIALSALYVLAIEFLKSEEEIVNDWRKEAGCGD